MDGFGTVTGFSTRLQKTMDGLQLTELTGNWAGGYLMGNVSLRNSDKNALLSTDLKWSGAKLNDFYRLEDGSAPLGASSRLPLISMAVATAWRRWSVRSVGLQPSTWRISRCKVSMQRHFPA